MRVEMIAGTMLHRYIGDEHGSMSVLKYDSEDAKLLWLPYHITANSLKGNFLFR
jgi:syntaxin-binding protein 5